MHFYPFDKDLLAALVEYFSVGLKVGDTCIAIATPQHMVSLNAALRANGIDVLGAVKRGQYVMYDASETLERFMVRGLPDQQRFLKSIGRMIYLTAGKGKPVRAFGEMVTLLWKDNNLDGLLQLEEYWHNLVQDHPFSLYCAYPEKVFDKSAPHRAAINKICACHSRALNPA